jgi:EamA domain-containing membrane protein RarD
MKFKFFVPLIGFVVPTLIITAILFHLEPPHISQKIGFCILMIAVCSTYYMGIKAVLDDIKKE